MFGAVAIAAVSAYEVKALADYGTFKSAAAPFRSAIAAAASKYRVGKHLLAAIFWQESRFDPLAVGKLGEVGLGQFRPIAALDVGISFDAIRSNVSVQIEATAKLMRLNIDRLKGDEFGALRAYNAGIGNAKNSPTASLAYALEVFNNAAIDFIATGVFGSTDA